MSSSSPSGSSTTSSVGSPSSSWLSSASSNQGGTSIKKWIIVLCLAVTMAAMMGDVHTIMYTPVTVIQGGDRTYEELVGNSTAVNARLQAENTKLRGEVDYLKHELEIAQQEKDLLQQQQQQGGVGSTGDHQSEASTVVERQEMEVKTEPEIQQQQPAATVEEEARTDATPAVTPASEPSSNSTEVAIPTSAYINGALPSYYKPPPTTDLSFNLWDNSTKLPQWLKEYFAWHQKERANVTEDNWESKRWLIHKALLTSRNGGTTDRIRSLPKLLRAAADEWRMIIIYWDRPFRLEEFLMPPIGGLDWRCPEYMKHMCTRSHRGNRAIKGFVNTQGGDYGDGHYDSKRAAGEATAMEAFHDMWRVMYTPAPGVAQSINQQFIALGISPGEYATAHIRARYARTRTHEQMIPLVENAVNCVSNLRPGGPFFVAADTADAIDVALDYGRRKNVTIVHAPLNANPHHIEHYDRALLLRPQDFYDSWVDIYIMAETRCVTHGAGGFGQWGKWLGYGGQSCAGKHDGRGGKKCSFQAADITTIGEYDHSKLPVFAQPMDPRPDYVPAKFSKQEINWKKTR